MTSRRRAVVVAILVSLLLLLLNQLLRGIVGIFLFDEKRSNYYAASPSPSFPTILHTKNTSFTVFFCGFQESVPKLSKYLFPEAASFQSLNNVDSAAARLLLQNHTDQDILLSTFSGPCVVGHKQRERNLPKVFRGRILFVNGEPDPSYRTDIVRPGVYSLGHEPDDGRTRLRVPYGTIYLSTTFAMNTQNKIYDPTKKPKNSGKHFLLYMQGHCVNFRERAFRQLAQLGPHPLHASGKCHGGFFWSHRNVRRVKLRPRNYYRSNAELFSEYRFALVMENKFVDGYITEKIINAFLGGTVPIWYGTRHIFDIFNDQAFIFYDIEHPEKALARIAYLEKNQTAYQEVLNQPILKDGQETVEKYFSFCDSVGGGHLKKRIRELMRVS